MRETINFDKKSLRALTIQNPNWGEIAKDCVAFANAVGGKIVFGIEDDESEPPLDQKIDEDLLPLLQKKIEGLTVNVGLTVAILVHKNGSEYLELTVKYNQSSIASTSKGKYYKRINDTCKPILPDELSRLMEEKGQFTWETKNYIKVHWDDSEYSQLIDFTSDIRLSERVSGFVKDKTNKEILDYYLLTDGDYLTNLGILWIGKQKDRAKLLYAPTIQFIKYDSLGNKINKISLDDYSKNPKELYLALMGISDWKEGVEIVDGAFRKNILNYEKPVIREIFVNALVHKPYTTRGDIFVNLYPERLEVHNPGLLPLGVTVGNILHKTVQRNPHLARIFQDLKLMEKEGTGYDTIYESLLASGKPLPNLIEGDDRVTVIVQKNVVKKGILEFIKKVNRDTKLSSKEIISLGLIAQHDSLTVGDFKKILGLNENYSEWLGRLLELGLIKSRGKTSATSYYIDSSIIKKYEFNAKTNLKSIESHKLDALIVVDLTRYGKSSIGDIHSRIGDDGIKKRKIQYRLSLLVKNSSVYKEGKYKDMLYFTNKK